MKKHTLFTIMMLFFVALFTASCSKEKGGGFPEEKLLGFWKIPIGTDYAELSGKMLTISMGHTAILNDVPFNYWKLEGNEIIFTRDVEHGYNNHELGVIRVTIADLTDSTMILVGDYTHAVNSTVDKVVDMSGCYLRYIPLPDIPTPPQQY